MSSKVYVPLEDFANFQICRNVIKITYVVIQKILERNGFQIGLDVLYLIL